VLDSIPERPGVKVRIMARVKRAAIKANNTQ
jgi:hypothetical protein